MENIIPSSDLRNKYPEISKLCRKSQKPIYITVNGRGDSVLLNIGAFQLLQEEINLLKELVQSEGDIRNDRFSSLEETYAKLRNKVTK